MKKILFWSVCIIALLAIACNKKADTDQENSFQLSAEHVEALNRSEKSPVIETRLFGDFNLGMSPQDFDKQIKKYCYDAQMVPEDCAGTHMAPIILEGQLLIDYVYEYRSGDDYFYADFIPTFVDCINKDSLVDIHMAELTMAFKSLPNAPLPKGLYKRLAEEFKKTPRGKQFKEFAYPDHNFVEFIKDNLSVSFYTTDSVGCNIRYRNIPDSEKLNKQAEEYRESQQTKNRL